MRAAAILTVLVCVFAGFASAQSTDATITGRVLDPTNAVIAGATVQVIEVQTNMRRTIETNEEGIYVAPNLKPGIYRIEISKPGFKTVIKPDVTLHVQDVSAINFTLPIGSVTENITVTAGAPLLSTESGTVGTVVDRQFVGNLPLNGRTVQSLILLTPGVVAPTVTSNAVGAFSVNGQRVNANYFTVDGVSANIGVSTLIGRGGTRVTGQAQAGSAPGFSALGSSNTLVSIDALEEFRNQTSTYSAKFGRQPGAQISLVTRSGTNEFHGSLFEYLRNEVTDANDWFANRAGLEKAPLRQNQFGGTLSGPVILPKLYDGHNRTFFFFSYEGLRLRLPVTVNTFVPSLRLRQNAPRAVQTLLNLWPQPTGPETMIDDDFDPTTPDVPSGVAPFVAAYSNPSSMDATSIRIDHTFSHKMVLFGRYSEGPSTTFFRRLADLSGLRDRTRTVTLGTTLSLSPRLHNEFRFNYSRNVSRFVFEMDDLGGAVPVDPSVLVSGFNGPGPKLGTIVLFLPGMDFPSVQLGVGADSDQRQVNVVDNVAWVKGAHTFEFGIDYRRLAPTYGPTAYDQTALFFTEADILGGTTPLLIREANQGARPLFHNFSAYAQDTWKVVPRLTMDLGLRWEVNPAAHDRNGLEPVLVAGVRDNGDVSGATLAPPGTPFYDTFWTAFAPRVGVAYQLRKKPGWESVLRGGFGVYYDLGSGQTLASFSEFPFIRSKLCPSFDPADPEPCQSGPIPWPIPPTLAQPPAVPPVQLPLTNIPVTSLDRDLKLPYTLQWNIAWQQALGANQTVTLSYVASAGRRLLTSQSFNNRPTTISPRPPRPNPNFGEIRLTRNGPTSDYHSLQAQFERRWSRGLQALVNYAWSHAIDEVSSEVAIGTLERGNASFDVRHNFSTGVTYDIPKVNAGPILTSILRDWSIDSTMYGQSGLPVNLTFDSFFAGNLFSDAGTLLIVRPDVVPGEPFWIKDQTAPGGKRMNPAAFQLPPTMPLQLFPGFVVNAPTRQGTLGRNVVRVPGWFQFNVGLGRQFHVTERWKLQFKAEAFNLFNHPLFGDYDTRVDSPSFGLARSMLNTAFSGASAGGLNQLYQLGGPRSMQFSLKLNF